VLHLDAEGEVYEVSGTVITRAGLDLTVRYELELEDGNRRTLHLGCGTMPDFYRLEGA
jgi:hypothetical protein